MEEFYAVYGDDDKEFVGSLGPTGFFTPASTGPIRSASSAAIITATSGWWPRRTRRRDKDGKPLVGRSYLVVTVPMYIRWDQPEVGQ